MKTLKFAFEINWPLVQQHPKALRKACRSNFLFITFKKILSLVFHSKGVLVPSDFGRSINSLSQPEGQIIPTTLLLVPLNFQTFLRPCDGKSSDMVRYENSTTYIIGHFCKQKVGLKKSLNILKPFYEKSCPDLSESETII